MCRTLHGVWLGGVWMVLASAASAQAPPASTENAAKAGPKIVVITNVNLKIATQVNVSAPKQVASAKQQATFEHEPLAKVLPALAPLLQGGTTVVVLTNVSVDVSTLVDILRKSSSDAAAEPMPVEKNKKQPERKKPAQ